MTVTASAEIHPRARGDDVAAAAGFFAFQLKAVPAQPTHCRGRGCGVLLEPMRRYAGLCKLCVGKVAKRAKRRRGPRLRILRDFMRHGEKHIEVECSCGNRRIMRLSTYNTQRPQRCKVCRLREASTLRAAARAAHLKAKAKRGR